MEHVSAQQVFDEARAALEGRLKDGTPCERDIGKAEQLLHELLNNNPGHYVLLYTIGSLYADSGRCGLAATLLEDTVRQHPEFGEAWNNLGLAYKGLGRWDDAVRCAKKACELVQDPDMPNNVSALHVNRGMPFEVIHWAQMALVMDPNHQKARWHMAMGLLESGQFEKAWEYHEARLVGGGNYNISERNYHGPKGMTPWWDGKDPGLVVIHGEQGMGDEVMFASCIPDMLENKGVTFVLECSPRLQGLMQRSFPSVHVRGTNAVDGHEWIPELGRPDYKVAIGSLPKFCRTSVADFPRKPFLKADPERQLEVMQRLNAIGQRPKVGLAWQGGVKDTRVDARSFPPIRLGAEILGADVDFVSLQYDPTAKACAAQVEEQLGVTIHHWPDLVEAVKPTGGASDMDDLAALISCLDLVITVPQTCYHIAGGLGVETWVMTPSEPDWRLGVVHSKDWWYGSVELIRQPEFSRDWNPVFNEVASRLANWVAATKPHSKRKSA